MANDDELLSPGERLGALEIQGQLGKGGFGVTYLALDHGLSRHVAVKEYLPQDWGTRQPDGTVGPRTRMDAEYYQWGLSRFLTEAKTLARFDHPNIMRVYSVLEARGTAYLVSEYVEGPGSRPRSLADELKEAGTLSEARVRGLLDALTAGLEPVHAAGLVHRDIKPANIMLRPNGAPVLIDFGAARQTMGRQSKSMTLTQVLTPKYAPIEQYSSRGHQGPWTDIYSLGAVAYFALSGQLPGDATERVRSDDLARLRFVAPQPVSGGLARAVEAALAVNETDRPQSLGVWRAMLAASEDEEKATGVGPEEDDEQPPEEDGETEDERRSSTWMYGAVACVAIALAGLAFFWPTGSPPAGAERAPAAPVTTRVPPAEPGPTDPEETPGGTSTPGASPATGTTPPPGPETRGEPPPVARPSVVRPDPPAGPSRGAGEGRARREIDGLIVDANNAEAAGELDAALSIYEDVLRRDPDNPAAAAGRTRVGARIDRNAAQELLRGANGAFVAGRYDDARRLYREAHELVPSPEAEAGLRHVDNAEALLCTAGETACATLVVRVRPAATMALDDLALGTRTTLELSVSPARHRIDLETAEYRYGRWVELSAGGTHEYEVDMRELGFPK